MIDRFQLRWESGSAPNVNDFVTESGPLSPSELAHLLLVDQSYRHSLGTPQPVAVYFERFPELLDCAEAAIDLLYAEFLQREASEPELTIDQFIQPYPQFEDEFRRQVSFHRSVFSPLHQETLHSSAEAQTTQSLTGNAVIPGYEMFGELGRGGLGVVYLARDIRLNRHVALKMLLAGRFASANLPKRLLLEAEATARLQHPNIVQIYEVGQHAGHPFLALEYISGGTLAAWMERRPQAPRDAAQIVRDVARAIQFAHEKGVIHRDLKPSNLLLQPLSSARSSIDGQLPDPTFTPTTGGRLSLNDMLIKVADFGLAKLMEASTSGADMPATLTGDLVGTAAYMSPEQALAGPTSTSKDSVPLTAATDIYSLGAILYELLTGRPPFVGVQPLEVLAQVINDEPIRPSQLVKPIPKDLQTICLKCLEKNPKRRYATAAALAEDLERYLTGQPILGRHPSTLEKVRRWCRRNPMKTAAASLVAGLLVMIASVSILYSMMLGNQLALITQSEMVEKSLKTKALELVWESSLSQADALRSSHLEGQRFESLKAIDTARALASSMNFSQSQVDRMRNATIAALALSDLQVGEVQTKPWPKTALLVSMDNSLTIGVYRSEAGEAVVQRIDDGTELARIGGCAPASKLALSSDGTKLAVVDKQCRIYDVRTPACPLLLETIAGGLWILSHDGQQVAGTNQSGQLQIIELSHPSEIRTLQVWATPKQFALSPDSRMLAMLRDDSVEVVECKSGKLLFRVPAPGTPLYQAFEWHPSSTKLAVGPYGHGIELWDIEGYRLCNLPMGGPAWFRFDRTGSRLLAYHVWSQSLNLCNIYDQKIEFAQAGQKYLWLAENPVDGFDLLRAVDDNTIARANIVCPKIYQALPATRSDFAVQATEDLAYSPDGRLLAYAKNNQLDIFDSVSFTRLLRETVPRSYVQFAPDGSLLTSTEFALDDRRNILRGVNRWARTVDQQSDAFSEIVFGPPEPLFQPLPNFSDAPFMVADKKPLVAIARVDGFQLWSLNKSQSIQSQTTHGDVRRVSISPDGKCIATGGWNSGDVCIWDAETGRLQHTIREPTECAVQYSPDGQQLAIVADEIKVWDAKTWQLLYKVTVNGRPNNGVSICFSPDSHTLAASDSYGRIHLIESKRGKEYMVLTGPSNSQINRLTYSPDGSQLAVLSGAKTAAIWHLDKLQTELQQRELGWADRDQAATFLSKGDVTVATSKPPAIDVSKSNLPQLNVKMVLDERFRQLEAGAMIQQASLAAQKYMFEATRHSIARALKLNPQDPTSCNNLAWLLATGPVEIRDPKAAIELAETAIKNAGESGYSLYANTLGVAQYRAGLYHEAIVTLKTSLAHQPPNYQAFDLYFLSMCSAQLDDQDTAQGFFKRAEALSQSHRSAMTFDLQAELNQFRQEAQELLTSITGFQPVTNKRSAEQP